MTGNAEQERTEKRYRKQRRNLQTASGGKASAHDADESASEQRP